MSILTSLLSIILLFVSLSYFSISAISKNDVVSKLNECIDQYAGKTVTSAQLYMGSQCKGFANWVFLKIFGVYIGPYPESANYKINNPNAKEGEEVVLGIRAESVRLSNDDVYDFEAVVSQRYTMGKEELAFLKIGNQTIRVYLSSDYDTKEGETVKVDLKDKGIFLFDKESGERI